MSFDVRTERELKVLPEDLGRTRPSFTSAAPCRAHRAIRSRHLPREFATRSAAFHERQHLEAWLPNFIHLRRLQCQGRETVEVLFHEA